MMWVGLLLAASPAAAEPVRTFGVMTDVGVPDGATASVVVRPVSAVRLSAGVAYNGVSTGGRVGVTLAPVPWWISPTLSLDYGRYPEGDANPLARRVSGDDTFESSLLDRIGYDFADAHAGFVLGRKRASFYIQAGYSRTSGTLHPDTSMSAVTFTQDPRLIVWSVSARLGLVVYIY
jgi:hypothetical protein